MFTVVITEQKHIDSIQEYKSFLRPFLDNPNIAFCSWRTDGEDLADAVPDLALTVAPHAQWRALVVCDCLNPEQKNPFNAVDCQIPPEAPEADPAEYLEQVTELKFRAFEQASKTPLVRLMTWLCASPTITKGLNNAAEDLYFSQYLKEANQKEALRLAIRGTEPSQIILPSEVLCISQRRWCCPEYDIRASWSLDLDSQYSRFYDWNLYFDKMRYLLFDILPKNHRNYAFDYIRFLYTLMLLAAHEAPQSALKPNRVYTLNSETDENALQKLLGRYDAKLAATQTLLQAKAREIENREKPRLCDQDAKRIFCGNITIPVNVTQDFDTDTLYADHSDLGLATDCPTTEVGHWEHAYQTTRRALGKFLKIPRRALKKASAELRLARTADLSAAGHLNEFQLEDVAEHTAEEERLMVAVPTCDLYNVDRYTDRMAEQDKANRDTISTRMLRKTTVILGAACLGVYLLSFIPMLISNIAAGKGLLFSLYFALAGLGIMSVVSLITLLFLRKRLVDGYKDYNAIMSEAETDVHDSADLFSQYLSHACNVMRGNSVLNFRKEHEHPDELQLRLYKKHRLDLQRAREELREVFGNFMTDELPEDVDPYPYDFNRMVDFPYPIPFTNDYHRQVEFMQSGYTVQAPVNFVRRITVRREELYD